MLLFRSEKNNYMVSLPADRNDHLIVLFLYEQTFLGKGLEYNFPGIKPLQTLQKEQTRHQIYFVVCSDLQFH